MGKEPLPFRKCPAQTTCVDGSGSLPTNRFGTHPQNRNGGKFKKGNDKI